EDLILADNDWDNIDFENPEYIGSSRKFEILNPKNISLNLSVDNPSIVADGESFVKIQSQLLNDGEVLTSYNGDIKFDILTKNLGGFKSIPPSKMVNGVLLGENLKFVASNLSGDAEVLVEVPGFASNTVQFKTLPGKAKTIKLTASSDTIYSDGISDVILEARLFDENGNLVDSSDGTGILVNFNPTDATSNYIVFPEAKSSLTSKGIASVRVRGGDISGKVNISATAEGIEESDSITIDVTKHFSQNEIKEFSPRALYVSLLGGAFGNYDKNHKNLSETMLYSEGQVQAVSSLTANFNDKKRVIGVDAYGKIDVFSENIESTVVPATSTFPYQKIIFSDLVSSEELAYIFMVTKANAPLVLLKDQEFKDFSSDGIYVKSLSSVDPDIEFIEKEDGIYIDKKGETKVKIDKFGRISINDSKYSIRLLNEDDSIKSNGLTFIIDTPSESLLAVSYNQSFDSDVKYFDYDDEIGAFLPGVYFKMKVPVNKYSTTSAFSRNSTNEPTGLYFIDTENDLDASQSPGNKTSSGVGFGGQNKHMLFFSAGNSLGKSHLPYGSEVDIIYGDPNVRLEVNGEIGGIVNLVSNLSGYTKTIEKSIYTGDKDIKEMIDFDYNGDGLDDLLLLYEDGRIRLLLHEISNSHFFDKGYILNIYGGIHSATKLDVNNDGYDDLILGTKEACIEGEKSVSLFINKNGSFQRETLNLSVDGTVFEMKSHDMNADGCEDLVASDSAGNVRIFFNTNDGRKCTGLNTNYGYGQNYGFSINPDANIKNSLFIYYSGVEALYEGDPLKNYADSNSDKFVTLVLQSDTPPEGSELSYDLSAIKNAALNNPAVTSAEVDAQTYPEEFNFIHLPVDGRFGLNSSKQAIDLNGGTVS
ncbi:MAG: FG-GAP-like repeat-containing protein, partial [Candidatus Gracilibacteria bacterium]|nr:FG-GAP-like repeat-containing protein [Candidatus Gracilibacteria bacterium]